MISWERIWDNYKIFLINVNKYVTIYLHLYFNILFMTYSSDSYSFHDFTRWDKEVTLNGETIEQKEKLLTTMDKTPEKVAALLLRKISEVAPGTQHAVKAAIDELTLENWEDQVLETLFSHDFPFWTVWSKLHHEYVNNI